MRPQVSVLIPVYNAEATLDEALASTLNQSLRAHEILLMLNGCTDRSLDIAQSWAQRDARVRPIQMPVAGIVPALNLGLEMARSPLVARLDADDLMLPERLQHQVAAMMDNPSWSLVASHVQYQLVGENGDLDSHGDIRRYVQWLNTLHTPEDLRSNRFIDSPVAHPSVMYRRNAVRELGGYDPGPVTEDYELWLRMFEAGKVFGTIPQALVVWRDRADRLTRIDPRCAEPALRRLKHKHLLSGPLKEVSSCRIWGAGPEGQAHARELLALGARVDDLIGTVPPEMSASERTAPRVTDPREVGGPDGRMVLLTVPSGDDRGRAERHLHTLGYQRDRDYLMLR